ncbi:MAG: tetratricopeptide repeat protein [Luteitalea sp.]|nr:tetratricopeptide repeat protein [Luteitalea sp.]
MCLTSHAGTDALLKMRTWIVLAALLFLATPRAQTQPQSPALLDVERFGARSTLRVPDIPRKEDVNRAIHARDWARVERLLVEEIDRRPNAPEVLKLLARVFLIDQKPLNAAIAIKKAEALAPLDEETRYTLVLAYVAIERHDWARAELNRLVASDSDDPRYQYWLARLDYDGGLYASAIERLEGVIARDPDFIRAHDNLGLCYEAQNRPDKAIVHYHKAIDLNRRAATKSVWPPLNLAVLLRSRGELGEAEALLREAVRYDQASPRAHYELGRVLEELERADAVEALQRAVSLDASYPDPHYALARIYRVQGRAEEARQALATFKRLDAQQEARP